MSGAYEMDQETTRSLFADRVSRLHHWLEALSFALYGS